MARAGGPTRRGHIRDRRCVLCLHREVAALPTPQTTSPEAGAPLPHPWHFTPALPAVPRAKHRCVPTAPRGLGTGGDAGLQTGSRTRGGSVSPRLPFAVGSRPGGERTVGFAHRGLHKPCLGVAPWPDPALGSPSTACRAREVAADGAWPALSPELCYFTLIYDIQQLHAGCLPSALRRAWRRAVPGHRVQPLAWERADGEAPAALLPAASPMSEPSFLSWAFLILKR